MQTITELNMSQQKKKLILASGSSIRAQMLNESGLDFDVVVSPIDEEALKAQFSHASHKEQSMFLSNAKAEAVSLQYPESLVLAADQICECDQVVLSKPGCFERAQDQLSFMNGKTHFLHTSTSLYHSGQPIREVTQTATLTMKKLTQEEIDCYLQHDEPYQSCGSYRLEATGRQLFEAIDGSDEVILGLSLTRVLDVLCK